MLLICEKHGNDYGYIVSPDLKIKIENKEKIKDFIIAHYTVEGEIALTIRISKEFAKEIGVETSQNESTYILSNEDPPWLDIVQPVCQKCFNECEEQKQDII